MEALKVSKLAHRHSDHMPESGIWLGGGEADWGTTRTPTKELAGFINFKLPVTVTILSLFYFRCWPITRLLTGNKKLGDVHAIYRPGHPPTLYTDHVGDFSQHGAIYVFTVSVSLCNGHHYDSSPWFCKDQHQAFIWGGTVAPYMRDYFYIVEISYRPSAGKEGTNFC